MAAHQPSHQLVTPSNEQLAATMTLAEMPDFSPAQKQEIVKNTLAAFQSMPTPRGRYIKSHKDFSKAQVVKISQHGYATQGIAALLPGPLKAAASLVYGSYYNYFHTAASKGWGVRITLTVDSYVPTSAGMSWSISYIK